MEKNFGVTIGVEFRTPYLWGLRDNRQGRLLAVKILEALATEKARFALDEILALVRNQEIQRKERELIHSTIRNVAEKQYEK